MFKKYILPGIAALVFAFLYFFFALPAINIRDGGFWMMLILTAVVYFILHFLFSGKMGSVKVISTPLSRRAKLAVKIAVIAAACVVVLIIVTSTKLFHASQYQSMLQVSEGEFKEDIAEIPLSRIPVVDRDSAMRLGSRKIGEVVELVSQFDVTDYYTQINYQEVPYRVSPLAYADILKWFVNREEGIPYYVKIDMATQDTELVKLESGMKYSPSEYLMRDLMRHVRFAYPTKLFEETSFEIDDNGHPYWILSYYHYTIGFLGGRDIAGIIMVDAVSGEMTDYPVSEVPSWVDRVYPADLVLEQANNWGALKNGFWNSIFTQKNVVKTTDGYNYLALNDDVWLYTGITSVVSDNSNIGFILINMRTKESKTYSINGAEEYSAMASAEGMIQEKGYTATFPILVNIADTPSYFISLKDNAGLVKAYSFVAVSQYQTVGVADTIEGAEAEYRRLLGASNEGEGQEEIPAEETVTITGRVSRIASAVKDGNSLYYIEIDGSLYTAGLEVSDILPLLLPEDTVTITYVKDSDPRKAVSVVRADAPA